MAITIKSNRYQAGHYQDEFAARNYYGSRKKGTGMALTLVTTDYAAFSVEVTPLMSDSKVGKPVVITPSQLNPKGIRAVGPAFLDAIAFNMNLADIQYFGKNALS